MNSPLIIKNLPDQWLFPTTRYRGSKRKILPWIWETLNDLSFNTALDLFGGTAIVSILMKRMGKEITYNDYLKYNYIGGLAMVENNNIRLSKDDINFICSSQSNVNYNSLVFDTFSGYYYNDSENEWLDKVIGNISFLDNLYSAETAKMKKSIALWALGQSCLIKRPFNLFHRKNLYLRENEVKRQFGNKTTWEKPFHVTFKKFALEANRVIFDNKRNNKAYKKNAFQIKQNGYDLVYFDPPYFFKNQKDSDYRDLYHFLEGLLTYNKWLEMINWNSSNLKLKENGLKWPSKNPKQLLSLFEELIEEFKSSTIIFSHKSGSLVSVGAIQKILEANGKKVFKKMKRYKYALSKKNGKPRSNIEWLLVGI
ncbi:MAG: DNA methyltransferase [Chloroflexi bacterium]|nr:DNA methyltransferase [Chloroflexota bacterium]